MFVLHSPDPVAFDMFGLPIYWYGIAMAIAILIAMVVGNKLFSITNPTLKKDVIIEYAPVIIISGVICARLYFCLLNADYYLANPSEIMSIRQGGLSIHGAIFGGIFSMIAVAKQVKLPSMCILDAMACGTLLGQVIGRWGNYFNSEAYGIPVASQSWGLFIPEARRVAEYANYTLFHPTFLYESVLNLIGFGILLFIILKFGKKFQGLTFFSYLCLYSVIRFFIERIRVDSAFNVAGDIPIAIVISIILLVVGVVGVVSILLQNRKSTQ
ncbi:prolipoprotein diacylglyceryl transferase [bacterium]|nr:prolipoprotein diacylglyceryl transferase [bacterium]